MFLFFIHNTKQHPLNLLPNNKFICESFVLLWFFVKFLHFVAVLGMKLDYSVEVGQEYH